MRGVTLTLWLLLGVSAPVSHASELLVANKSADTVWRLSLKDGRRIGEFRTGDAPHEITVSPDGSTAVVSNYGGVRSGNTLSVLDLATGKPSRQIDLGQHGAPHGVRFLTDGRRVVVTTEASARLLVVDITEDRVDKEIDIGDGVGHMVALSPDERFAYVAKIAKGAVSRVDLAAGVETHERPAGKGAEGIAVRPDGREIWVTNREDGTITVHDPKTLAIRRRMTSQGFPIRVTFSSDGRMAFVTKARSATLEIFDARTKLSLANVALSREDTEYQDTMLGKAALPIGVIVDPDRPRAYVAISGGDRVAVIDTERWQVIDYWVAGREPDALAIVPRPAFLPHR